MEIIETTYIDKLLIRLSEKREYTLEKPALVNIINRAVSKFFDEAEERIILYDLKHYIVSQMEWKKQDMYYDLLPVLFIACERLDSDFEILFANYEKEIMCWGDAYDCIYY